MSYKILWLGLSLKLSFLGFLACSQGRLFLAVFMENMADPLVVNMIIERMCV